MNTLLTFNGSKRWLVPYLKNIISPSEDKFVELFAGTGAISFLLEIKYARLNDKNKFIINLYEQIKNGLDIFSQGVNYSHDKSIYKQNLAELNDMIKQGNAFSSKGTSLFYYISRKAFKGIITGDQTNIKATFLSPRHKNIYFNINNYQKLMEYWQFTNLDFEEMQIYDDEIIYADPPYDNTTGYLSEFEWEDHIRLCKFLSSLNNRIIISEKWSEKAIDLYSSYGFKLITLTRNNAQIFKNNRTFKELLIYKNIDIDNYIKI